MAWLQSTGQDCYGIARPAEEAAALTTHPIEPGWDLHRLWNLSQHWGKLPENWEFSHCKRQEVRQALHRIPERKPAA